MSILIKGMEMPKDGNWRTVRIHPDGSCFIPNWQGDCTLIKGAQAVPVPPHGRLIDADALFNIMKTEYQRIAEAYGENDEYAQCLKKYGMSMVINAPTIIEAEEEDE